MTLGLVFRELWTLASRTKLVRARRYQLSEGVYVSYGQNHRDRAIHRR